MKNILIMGIGRAGKTTLSEKLKEKYNSYNLIHSDSIKWGIIRAEQKEDYYRKNIAEQKEFETSEKFQRTLLEIFRSLINNDIKHYGYILESGQLEPKIVSELIDFENTIVICLGHGELTKEDIINLCLEHDRPKDWSYKMSYEDLEKHAESWAEKNQLLKRECPKYGIEYIDTSKDREKVLIEILEKLSREIEKNNIIFY